MHIEHLQDCIYTIVFVALYECLKLFSRVVQTVDDFALVLYNLWQLQLICDKRSKGIKELEVQDTIDGITHMRAFYENIYHTSAIKVVLEVISSRI